VIARVWRGVVARDRRDEYVAYVDATGVAEYRAAPGCTVSMILTRELGDGSRVEVVAFSVWADAAALRTFTGPDVDAMVLYPEDEGFLLEPPTLIHYEVGSLHR
jgi:hypothetical protein